jgi:hypothetical protein
MLQCRFCDATVISEDEACDRGWIPSFWDGRQEVFHPVCPRCVPQRLRYHPEFGDYELVPEGDRHGCF